MKLEEILKKYKKPKKTMPLKNIIRVFIREGIENFYICRKEDIDVLIEGAEHLQKENEELRIDRDNYKGCFIVAKENSVSKDKIMKYKKEAENTECKSALEAVCIGAIIGVLDGLLEG